MRRQRRTHTDDDYYPATMNGSAIVEDFIQMGDVPSKAQPTHRFENTIEAKIQEGDTLQAMALRFHCTVADIKRLNKIDKENEIYARKVIKIPVTVHSVLVGAALPGVHKSGNSSPKASANPADEDSSLVRNPLLDASTKLGEKLMVASVNASGPTNNDANVNSIILNSTVARSSSNYKDSDPDIILSAPGGESADAAAPLLSSYDEETVSRPRPVRGPALTALDWSGSDCDMSWVCLFVVILALCFVIPLIYVIYLAEHPHHHNTTSH